MIVRKVGDATKPKSFARINSAIASLPGRILTTLVHWIKTHRTAMVLTGISK
jgi:hypothetical protein